MRLDRFLSEIGIGTRKNIKQLIKAGRISVNGEIAKSSDMKIDEKTAVVTFDGKPLQYREYEYYMLHKPAGVVSATEDRAHKTVIDLITETKRKDLFPVGRLDIDTEGLLLITNDGDMAHRLLAPEKHVDKCYMAYIRGELTGEDIRRFETGIDIGEDGEEQMTAPAALRVIRSLTPDNDNNNDNDDDNDNDACLQEVEVTIHEGKYHQIKRMFAALGKEVVYLKRLSMGSLRLDEKLLKGEYRRLTDEEINNLKK
ncbi:MAG: rRNA pseudouridine synthase [Eubacterium sp.]|nr:rRNA pseudouridine synthase [Eubacterium sp.]